MSGKPPIQSGISAYTRNNIASRAVLMAPLFLALALASASPTTPAVAAPSQQGTMTSYDYSANVNSLDPIPFCANTQELIAVGVFQEATVVYGKKRATKHSGLGNIFVTAAIADPRIGTLDTHANFTNPPLKGSEYGHALFWFTGKEEGKTQINFTANIPASRTGTVDLKREISFPVQVRICEYSVFMTLVMSINDRDVTMTGIGVTDEIALKRKQDTEEFEGSGPFKYFGGVGHTGDCRGDIELKSGPIQFTGHLADKKLALTMKFSPGLLTNHIKCPSNSVDASIPWIPLETSTEDFSASGETKTIDILGGVGILKASITVMPKKK